MNGGTRTSIVLWREGGTRASIVLWREGGREDCAIASLLNEITNNNNLIQIDF